MGIAQGEGAKPDLAKPDLDVGADSRAVPVLKRLQTRSGSLFFDQAFPRQESRFAADTGMQAGATAADNAQLDYLLPSRRRELVRWEDASRGNSFFLSPGLESGWQFRGSSDSDQTRLLTGLGMTVYGKAFHRLTFYSRGSVYTEFTDRPQFTHQFDPEYGESYSVEKGAGDSLLANRSFNRFEHYVRLDLPGVSIKAGRDRVHMGPGYFSSLMATRDTPPYYLLEARIDFAPWLTLDDYLIRMTDTRHDVDKYANLHRFEFKPGHGLSLGFQDIVIYQERGVDWRYALPLTPLAFSEDNLGGEDNDAMGFDFLYAGLPLISLWGEVFIDDLLGPGTFFDGFWENRWAALAGFQVVSPWAGLDADLVVELSRVEPWTYTGAASFTSFKHFNAPSASKLGPDSRSLDVQAAYRPFRFLQLTERMEFNDKGGERQAQLGLQHRDGVDPEEKIFLDGEVISDRVFTQQAEVYWRQYLTARLFWSVQTGSRPGQTAGMDVQARW